MQQAVGRQTELLSLKIVTMRAEIPEDLSCPNCEAKPMILESRLTISQMKKLKMDFCALCCCRRYCRVGMYKRVYKCRSCGWERDEIYLPVYS
ncbi:uncharacterized protein LOC108096924 [Drosophila ficusphila]|uniref:uncharacterized protein LOC108096924 n=1 Tax=Drosophila ficusphila TaxID=30025 RepID=UPI0007E624E1|nr:uncharacterized protein LOC108096924 [Drosophila ficusphila]